MPIRQQLASSFSEKSRQFDFWLNCALFVCLAVALWPLTVWFAQTAHDQSRLLHALVVLTMASVLLVRFGGVSVSHPFELNSAAKRALLVAYGFLVISYSAQYFSALATLRLLIIPSYCCALAAAVRFVFGEGTRWLTRTVAGTLCVFLYFSIWMEPLDWPLRSMAGQWSSYALGLLGQHAELGLMRVGVGPPMLILMVNEHPYHVASECNGFGVILTSLLLALLLAIYRRLSLLALGLYILAGVIIGFTFNIIRIVIIVLLAPALMEHYHLMHEIVGGITYWACLLLVWLALKGPTQPETN